MAARNFLAQLNILKVSSLTDSGTTFVGFSAKSDGLYMKNGSGSDLRLLTTADANYFTLSGNSLYPNSTSYNLLLGTTSNATGVKLLVSGDAQITNSLQVDGWLNGHGISSMASFLYDFNAQGTGIYTMVERATMPPYVSGFGNIYTKTDKKLYFLNDAGVEYDLVGGSAASVANSLILKFDTGSTEGTSLYTFNGSAAKTIDIKAGTNITLTKAAGSITISASGGSGTVTSVAMTVPTGLSISGSPISTSGTLALSLTAGYSIPTTANQTNWTDAYTYMGKVYIPLSPSIQYAVPNTSEFQNYGDGTMGLKKSTSPTSGDTLPITSGGVYTALLAKQETLVSGTNIKTVAGSSILGSGNIAAVTSVTSGNGMYFTAITGTGSITLGTPSDITSSSTNSVTTTSHTHALANASVTYAKISAYGTPTNGQALCYSTTYGMSWYTLNTGSGVSGRVTYWSGTNTLTSDADFTFDGINLRVGATNGTGIVYSGNFTLTSDRLLKRNISVIENLNKFDQLNFVQFQYIADKHNSVRYGVIAQEVEKFAPELVLTDSEGMKSVSYIDLLICKIAQLEDKIKKLERR